ncbi:glycoside hydrolase family 172 protein [Luteithermobacter gelatinilyticus]|uniref:glycoside hydrolase family 172 protein n=1 Tax=Luteithermobacter gelatinilyticus TaxID=2582913 RepID=UPI001106B56E|nr:glycoside hydrolase family 172 protein [Luteithermobacter gelatinilyticus]
MFSLKDLYDVTPGTVSRSISFENPTGVPGSGAKAASPLGPGRKGSPARHLDPGESLILADIEGPGIIRHIWLTTHPKLALLRGVLLRFYWDGQKHPSIEAPIGDFFGFAHGQTPPFETAVHSVGEKNGMNIWLPMPFLTRARVEIVNESETRMPLFFQIDYTLGDKISTRTGRLHVSFRRENPTQKTHDLEILNRRSGPGRYIGAVFGVRPLDKLWWGEGEFKAYIDGDTDFPTIVGTGAEDYVGLSWGIQQNAFRYHGANWREKNSVSDTGLVSMYRWHLLDPITWETAFRATIQQIGHNPTGSAREIEDYKAELYEREDDWSVTTFWYEPVPSAPLPPIPSIHERMANLPESTLKLI